MGNVYHIPIRSFSQRLEIFSAFCGQKTVVKFLVAGILKRRVPKSYDGTIFKNIMVIQWSLEE